MEFLGVGPLGFLFILIIVLLVFSPKDIEGGARKAGRAINRLYRSESYRAVQKTSDELRHLPDRLAEEARIEELEKVALELHREGETINREIADSADTLKEEAEKLKATLPDAAAESTAVSAAPPAAVPEANASSADPGTLENPMSPDKTSA